MTALDPQQSTSNADERRPLGKAYEPAAAEAHWYEYWHSGAVSSADRGEGPFVVVMPPPNVTGELHMGHALFAAVEDISSVSSGCAGTPRCGSRRGPRRHRRAVGGGDGAGQAGPDPPGPRARGFLGASGTGWTLPGRIRNSSTLGASCDWSRFVFTMDPARRAPCAPPSSASTTKG